MVGVTHLVMVIVHTVRYVYYNRITITSSDSSSDSDSDFNVASEHPADKEAAIPTLILTSDSTSPKLKRTLDLRCATLELQTGIYKYFGICLHKEHLDNICDVDEKQEDK